MIDNVPNVLTLWIYNLYEIISTQLIIVLLLVLLFIVYIIPKILETWLSNILSLYLPCDLTVHRFGFVFAQGIVVRFISGEHVYIRMVSLKSNLWDSSVSSLIVLLVDYVEFQTTHSGLHDIVQAIRRKNDGIYPQKNRFNRDGWPMLFIGSISKFFAVVIRDVHVGIWPTVQLVKANCRWVNWNSGLQQTTKLNQPPPWIPGSTQCFVQCEDRKPSDDADATNEKMTSDYLDWATNSKLAATLMLISVRVTFRLNRDYLRVRIQGSRLCSKLLSTSEEAVHNVVTDNDAVINSNTNNKDDDNYGELSTSNYMSTHVSGGMLLGHFRLYPVANLMFYRRSKSDSTTLHRRGREDREEWCWRPKSICLKLYGIRGGLMEELLELLKQRLHIFDNGSSSVPASPVAFVTRRPTTGSLHHHHHLARSVDGPVEISRTEALSSNGGSATPSSALHLCLSVLPLRRMTTNSPNDVDMTQTDSSDCNGVRYDTDDIGFRFELIRFVFKRSIQLTFQYLLFTGIIDSPSHRNELMKPGTHRAQRQSFLFSCSSLPRRTMYASSCESIDPNDDVDNTCTDSILAMGNGRCESDMPMLSMSRNDACNSVQFKLFDLHLVNGWDDLHQHCSLDFRLGSIMMDVCRRSNGCLFNCTMSGPQLLYIYSPVETEFFTELLRILVATSHWLIEQKHYSRGSIYRMPWMHRGTFPTAWTSNTMGLSLCPAHRSSLSYSFASHQFRSFSQVAHTDKSNNDQPVWLRLLTAFGLEQCHLTVQFRLGTHSTLKTTRQQSTIWPSLHSYAKKHDLNNDVCWPRLKDTAEEFFYPVSSVCDDVPGEISETILVLASHSSAQGIQMVLNSLAFTCNSNLEGTSVASTPSRLLCQSDAHLALSSFHLTMVKMDKLKGTGWLARCVEGGIDGHLGSPANVTAKHMFQAPRPSILLDRRSSPHTFDQFLTDSLPQSNEHMWGQVLTLFAASAQFHNQRLYYSLHGLQIEWPNEQLQHLSDNWPFMSLLPCTCSCTSLETAAPIRSISNQTTQSPMNWVPPMVVEGQVKDVNVFVVSINGAVVVLRVDTLHSVSLVKGSILRCDQLTPCPSPDRNMSVADDVHVENGTGDNRTLDSPVGFCHHQQTKLTVSAIKMTYHPRKITQRSSFMGSSGTMRSSDRLSFPLHTSEQVQHQLFWLPEITVELNNEEKLLVINFPQPVEFLWTPALHLCLLESINIGKELLVLYRTWMVWETNQRLPSELIGTSDCQFSSKSQRLNVWIIRFTATKSIQVFMHLTTAAHQVAFCLKNITLRSILPARSIGVMDSYSNSGSSAGVPSSHLKFACESALVRCDSESIAVFKQFTIRRREMASHHRMDYNKMGLVRNVNTAWEVTGDLCYFTFPYRYRFREVYLELTSTIKFIRTLSMKSSERRLHTPSPQPPVIIVTGDSKRTTKLADDLDAVPEEDVIDQCDTVHLPLYQSPVHNCSRCLSSPAPQPGCLACPGSIRADWIIRLKRLVLEVKDDPFESNLNDNHLVLQDEQIKHEERVAALEEQLQWAAQSGVRISESDRIACFARLEAQRAFEYRNRLMKFKQEFPTADELFIWTLDNVHLKVLADDAFAAPEQVIYRLRQIDRFSPWPHLMPSDFVTLWCRMISMNADRWRFQLRDYPKPWLEMTDLLLWGPLAGSERLADWKGQHTTRIHPGAPWPDYTLERNCWPLKFFYDWNADVKEIHMCYGANWEPTLAWLSQRLEDITPRPMDLSVPRLGWWDKVRHLLHGRLYIVSDAMHWLCSTSLNPYNATEFFGWQWNHSTVCWETGNFRLEGDLDILYHTASKYDGVCPLLHLPCFEMNLKLDWLSLRDPFDHHSVRPCNTERLRQLGINEHDSYRYFRGNRLAVHMSCTVRQPSDGAAVQPWCLFFTSVLKFADKLRMCLTKVARPIRRGAIFHHIAPKKPLFGRLLQSLDFSLNLPQLELTYWVSYAKRTGVHVTTGPVQLVAELRYSIEKETKVTFGQRRLSVLQPHVMLPPVSGCNEQPSGLLRRPQTTWTVVNLSSSLQDSRIQLRHRPDLPGQVVQMLLQNAHLSKEDTLPGDLLSSGLHTDLSEEFIVVPLMHYEQVAPTAPPIGINVRVHIPGRRVPTTMTCANATGVTVDEKPSSVATTQSEKCIISSTIVTVTGDSQDNNGCGLATDPNLSESSTTNDASQMTHENLTPTHRLEVRDMKLRWTEHTRDLVYMLMDTYQHAQSLKRNLSARATQAFHLESNSSGPHLTSDRHKSGGTLKLGTHNRMASTVSNSTSRSADPTADVTSVPSRNSLQPDAVDNVDQPGMRDANDPTNDGSPLGVTSAEHLESESVSDQSWLPGLGNVPMLAQLLEEVDTARFYAYCEEEPKQTDVVGQLQGLNICASSPVAARNWHVELINSQLLLKTRNLAGYVLVTAARAKLNALAHPPIWRDAQLLNKSSLVGHLEGMQYFATVGKVAPGTCDQWLSTADVSDWVHLNPSVDEDALSGRPEVVGCGRSVGGVVNACVGSHNNQGAPILASACTNVQPSCASVIGKSPQHPQPGGTPCVTVQPIQLQRMISRCSCQVFYVHYEPADPANLPLPHLIPPLPLDETDIVRTSEGADTVTILHHTLNICTNSPQYHMIVGIVNDLILYVEPQRKAQSERNRVALGLMSESQVRTAILRDQECLRRFVAEHRQLERYLWTFARQVMSSLDVDNPACTSSHTIFDPENQSIPPDLSVLARAKQASENARQLPISIQYVRNLESQVTQIKMRIVEQNALLSQRLAYYQQLQIKVQRRHMQVAMTRKRHHTAGVGSGVGGINVGVTGSSFALFHASASSASLLKQRKAITTDDRYSLSPTLPVAGTNSDSHNRAVGLDLHIDDGVSVCTEPASAALCDEQQQPVVTTETTATLSSSSQLQRQWSLGKAEAPPAAVVRRSEVCFEHAKWRMTESDGQIGLADVELRGFVYAKTHRQDDSGSHWLELGLIRVSNLVPDSFQKEVLAPDITCGHYAGGPILRIACSELPPVGGISVKGAMEISVAPMSLQISKHFYRVMMPFFFPEKSDESSAAQTLHQPISCDAAAGSSTALPIHSEPVKCASCQPDGSDHNEVLSDSTASKPIGRIIRRFYQPANLIRHLHRPQFTRPNPSIDLSTPFTRSTASPVKQSTTDANSALTDLSSFNLTVEAAVARRNSYNVTTDMKMLSSSIMDSMSALSTDYNRIGRGFLNQIDDVLAQNANSVPLSVTAPALMFRRPVVQPGIDSNYEFLLNQFANIAPGQQQTNVGLPLWSWSTTPPTALVNPLSVNPCSNVSEVAPDRMCAGTQNTPESSDPVDVMRERARQNNVFLYIKIPGFPICLSYKGEKQKNLTDVTRFQLYIPTLEYHNCVWTWLDFVMEVKTRIRRQLIREVIKKKFTPRRRLPLIHFGRSATERAAAGTDGTCLDTHSLQPSTSNPTSAAISNTEKSGILAAIAQEQRVQREAEMLLGRHAQQHPPQSSKWRRLRPHRP